MDRIVLLGRHHTELGEAALDRVGPVAVGLTRGRHPKGYPYTEPNEDAAMAAASDRLVLMAVADGHHGTHASHLAIEAIYDAAPDLVHLPAHEAVASALAAAASSLAASPTSASSAPATTLTVVAAAGEEGAVLGWGDSAAAVFHGRGGRSLTVPEPVFACMGEKGPDAGDPVRFRLRPGDIVIVATDGLTDFVVRPWPHTLAQIFQSLTDPGAVVEAALAAAGAGGGGDNLAICAFCMTS
ncbi:MAG: protein phosphatase 2C domain-containing protein [Actinomycetota bacterium]|nr:protein phosphatase 2C domain-containing protein [Actinomycetota bacterium]